MRKIVKGDTVKVLVGKDNGRTGVVLNIMKNGMVIVDGLNVYRKHQKADASGRKSGIMEVLKPFHPSNLLLICPACGKATRVGFKRSEDGKVERVCKKCGKVIATKAVNLTVEPEGLKKEKQTKSAKDKVSEISSKNVKS
jgi:large subunit ribosomal protein L24